MAFSSPSKVRARKAASFMRHAGVHELRPGMKNTLHEAAEEAADAAPSKQWSW
jgi:hypothetical protein